MNKTTEALNLAEEWLNFDAPLYVFQTIREALAEQQDKPEECAYGCPENTVCDYCQRAEPVNQEPVALLDVFSGWSDIAEVEVLYHAVKKLPDGEYKLYAAPVDAKAIRAEALEEAAKVCDEGTGNAVQANVLKVLRQERERIAEAIRGLK